MAVFVGDLINRGPDTEGVLHLVREMYEQNQSLVAIGNHEFRVVQESVRFGKLENKTAQPVHSLDQNLAPFP